MDDGGRRGAAGRSPLGSRRDRRGSRPSRCCDACSMRWPRRGIDAVALTADLGPRERYRRWLAGAARAALRSSSAPAPRCTHPCTTSGSSWSGTTATTCMPSLVRPYPHVREVAALRAHQSGAALIIGGYLRTAEAAALVQRGFLQSVVADRATVRSAAPRMRASSDAVSAGDPLAAAARLPTTAWRTGQGGAGGRPGSGPGAAPRVCAAAGLRTLPRARAVSRLSGTARACATGSRHRSASGARRRHGLALLRVRHRATARHGRWGASHR